jgi:hypothetical protein
MKSTLAMAISVAIHEASVNAGYPEDDYFHRFVSLDETDFRFSPRYPDLQKPRSEHVLMIEVLVSSETADDRKRSLLSAIVTCLQAAGSDPNDVMVFFGEMDHRHREVTPGGLLGRGRLGRIARLGVTASTRSAAAGNPSVMPVVSRPVHRVRVGSWFARARLRTARLLVGRCSSPTE